MTTFRPSKSPLYCAHCGDPRIMHMPEDMACVKQTEPVEIWPIVIKEMEALDLCVYLRQAIYERDGE